MTTAKPTASEPLLAKSASAGRKGRTLVQHVDDVMAAFDALFGQGDEPASLTTAWLRFFKLSGDEQAVPIFLRHGRVAAFCHDWGKANDGFQQMLARRGSQLIRHEHLSAVLIAHPPVWRWLQACGLDVGLVLAAVVCHHLKARDVDFGKPESEASQLLRLRWDDPELQRHMTAHAAGLGLSSSVPIDVPPLWAMDGTSGVSDLNSALDLVCDRLDEFDRSLTTNASRQSMLRAVRAALVAADSAGSGLPREGKDIADWIDEAFFVPRAEDFTSEGQMTFATIERAVVAPRMRHIGITESQLNGFQRACSNALQVPARALLLAPCGSGKTLAAWRWVAARCAEQPRRRAIFLYPTRGTATEGYRDYVALAGPDEAALVHCTADLDLAGIHADVTGEQRLNQARLFALRHWPKRLFSATVDQFLGFMQHSYAATCHLPLLADSVVVCDEVHSYDRGMFSALVDFLRHFDIPVLCMTATMLEGRRERLLKGGPELKDCGLAYVNGLDVDGGTDGDSELRKAADHRRYTVRRVADEAAAKEVVRQALAAHKRVLWVVNTVDRCQHIARDFAVSVGADMLTTKTGHALFCYHSRFRLKDRRRWHAAVVDAFKPSGEGGSPRGLLAIATQVCEMSLDLDADVLVTEVCPGTSLVQRMGRCCRDPKAHQRGRTGEVIIYEPPGDDARARQAPYVAQDLAGAEELIDALVSESRVSQAALETLLMKLPTPPELPKACRFIESGVWAATGEEQFRDIDDLTRPAVLINPVQGEHEPDDKTYARIWNPKTRGTAMPWEADALVINVPKSKGGKLFVQPHNGYDLPQWLYLAINGTYSRTIGFCCGVIPTTWIV